MCTCLIHNCVSLFVIFVLVGVGTIADALLLQIAGDHRFGGLLYDARRNEVEIDAVQCVGGIGYQFHVGGQTHARAEIVVNIQIFDGLHMLKLKIRINCPHGKL